MLGGIVVSVLGLRELAWLVTPAALALVIVVLVHPIYASLVRHNVPAVPALLVLVLSIYGVILGLVAVIVYATGRLATILPGYASTAVELLRDTSEALAAIGIGSEQIRDLYQQINLLSLAGWVTAQIPSVLGLTANLVLIYNLMLFVGIESTQVPHRFAALREDYPRLARSLVGFVANTRRYVAVTGAFAVLVGFLDTIFLLILGIPLAFLWGILAAACNFIPYVGFIIGLMPPALLALLDQGWQSMLLVIGVYMVLNSLITTIVPTKFIGSAVDLSMTVTMSRKDNARRSTEVGS